MQKKTRTLLFSLLAAALLVLLAAAGLHWLRPAPAGAPAGVAARWNGQDVLLAEIAFYKKTMDSQGQAYGSDREIAENLVRGLILLEAAEDRGLAATEAEIEEMVSAAETAYAMPSGRELIDQYCAAAGITTEEYFSRLRAQAPATIARQKLRDALAQDYCAGHGLDYSKQNTPAEVLQAVDTAINDIFAAHKHETVYYID